MPMRKRRHMAVFKGVMMAHAPVETDATTSGGWIGWMTAKMIPATRAAKPLQRMRLDAVTFILLFSLRRLWSGHLRSRVYLLPPVQQKSTVTSAEARTSSSMPDTVRELTYGDSCSKRAIADGLKPLTIGHMPSDSSQRASGIVAMACTAPPASITPNSTPTPETL